MKLSLPFFIGLFFLISCEKVEEFIPNEFQSEIKFDVSEWTLEDESTTCVDFDNDGNAWIASGNNLIFYNGITTESYSVGSEIKDISVSSDGKVWLGTKDKGLGCFSNGEFTFYTSENAGLPRNYVSEVEVAPDGSVWFSSSAHQLGGLVHYNGHRFQLYSPENSPMKNNLVLNLRIASDGNVVFTSEGKVGEAKVLATDGNRNWNLLDEDKSFYQIGALDLTASGDPVITTDHSLSSCWGCYTNEVIVFRNRNWEVIETDFGVGSFNRMFIDKRDYIWVQDDNFNYNVFDGKEWHRSEEGQIPDAFIKSAKVDEDNNIWFCTNNGIFIINQE